MTSSSLKPHILIRSYARDREWLRYCLASIVKNSPNIGITVVAPKGDNLGVDTIQVDPLHHEGYVDQQYTKLRANLYVPEGTTHVIHVDSDCFILGDLHSVFVDGKPSMLKTPWEMINYQAKIWHSITQKYVGFSPQFEYMRRLPLVYPIGIYERLDQYLTNLHGPWHEWFPKIEGRRFSEFNILGAYADTYMNEEFHWINTATDQLPEILVKQGWSWGGFDAAKPEWDRMIKQ